MGLSMQHTSEVPQVLKLSTGSIITHFNVVFDDQFTTVSSIERETEPPDHWEELCLENSSQILTDTESSHLHNDWLSPEEQEENRRDQQRETMICDSQMRRLNTEHHLSRTREQREPPRSVTPAPESPHNNVDERSTTPVAAGRAFVPIKVETSKPETEPDSPAPSTPGVRRYTRSTAGQRQTERYADVILAKSVTF
jgi:hypothetical protein